MARTYHEMPPLWWIQENLELTNEHPCGLVWKTSNRFHNAGDIAGAMRRDGRFYIMSMLGLRYPVHRVVFYLRTGIDPGNADVIHDHDNKERDNRLNLTLYQRRTCPPPKFRRRVRDADGNLVFKNTQDRGVSIQKIARQEGFEVIE